MVRDYNEVFQQAIQFQNSNELEKALILYKELISKNTIMKENSLCNVAIIYNSLGESNKALLFLDEALCINNKNPITLINKGLVLYNINRYDKALDCYNQCLKIESNNIYALFNKAILLYKIKKYKNVLTLYKKVQNLNKNEINQSELYVNFGDVFFKLCEYNNSLDYYIKSLRCNPNNFFALINIGLVYKNLGFYKKALVYYKKALEIDSSNADVHWNLSIAYLSLGKFKHGFKEFEYRTKASSAQCDEIVNTYPFPLYNGQSLKNKTILIHPEQGFGDNIQMIRYLKLFKKIDVKIYVLVLKEQKRLFETIPDINIVSLKDISWFKKIDYYIRILSLPYIFKTIKNTVPNKVPYFNIKEKNKKLNIPKKQINIGFVWQGEKNHENDKNRSVKLKQFEELIKQFPTINFYSLQLGEKTKIFKKYENVKDCSTYLDDFYETAKIVKQLDVVITIDSAVAHLSGAIGIKTWILLPKIPDWRWMLKTNKSPWYPTVKLFRQKKEKGWKGVFKKIKSELEQLHIQCD